jgi:hypothetical protein
MKKIYTLLLFLLCFSGYAQSPEKMTYQAVVRDANNTLLNNQTVGVKISILRSNITGVSVYSETQIITSNLNGLVSMEIGSGTTSDNFSTIDWSIGPYFIKTEIDPTGGESYSIIGTSQLLSVPFALYAKSSGSSIPGPPGQNGVDGVDGADGTNGVDGVDGADGADGADGVDGINGVDGADGADGADGTNGVDGINGVDGVDGTNGVDGADGVDGAIGPPGSDGQGGVSLAGTGISISGTGIITDPYEISTLLPTYELNTFYAALGGYVIDINSDGKHGVVLAMKDQGYDNWYNTNNLLNNPDNHDTDGAQFRDWRLPSKRELNLMYLSYLNGNPASLAGATYWSSSEFKYDYAWLHYFFSGQQDDVNKVNAYNIRAVRSF